ncbi:MAG: rod shape-determining protein MreC [Bacteroidetes bacterium]|nr:MAG: rod shape-determining protein MreC [Bacteroidota bacterium]
MKALINVIIRFHLVLLFIVLELISIRMVIFEDLEKKNAVFSSANAISGFFHKKLNTWFAYFSLAEENEVLRNENLELRNLLNKTQIQKSIEKINTDTSQTDSLQYTYISARVINNSIYKKQNYITLNKGLADGIKKEYAVINQKGIVGVVVAVSKHYSLVVSILNNRIRISAKIKQSNQFGSVHWNKNDYQFANLMEIPNHFKVSIGDTIVSSGFSAIFPPDINIGTITQINTNQSNNFYEINIKLTADFKSLYYVYVVDNSLRKEQLFLENTINDEH